VHILSCLVYRGALIFLRNNSLSIPILYLPKTHPAPDHMPLVPSPSVMDAKRFGLEREKWRQVNLNMPRSQFPDGAWSASIALPKGTTNPSWRPIPIVITISHPAPPNISVHSHFDDIGRIKRIGRVLEGPHCPARPRSVGIEKIFRP
jgi:hypothetical protein